MRGWVFEENDALKKAVNYCEIVYPPGQDVDMCGVAVFEIWKEDGDCTGRFMEHSTAALRDCVRYGHQSNTPGIQNCVIVRGKDITIAWDERMTAAAARCMAEPEPCERAGE